jgi:hypothetical protein
VRATLVFPAHTVPPEHPEDPMAAKPSKTKTKTKTKTSAKSAKNPKAKKAGKAGAKKAAKGAAKKAKAGKAKAGKKARAKPAAKTKAPKAAKAAATTKPAKTNANAATKAKAGKAAAAAKSGPWPGRFIWHDLMTKDAKRAQAFYCALFGWQIQELPMQGCIYRMINVGPGPIGGIVEEANIPMAHWMPYIAVADVDAAAARIKSLGGSVCVGPMDIPGTGRFAVVGDPQGGYFSIYKGLAESPGADPDQPVPGRACWNELWTSDEAAALKFYGAMFGWKDAPKDMGPMGTYHVQMLGDKQAGGIMKCPQPGVPTCWCVYFFTMDLDGSTARAKELGATVVVPPSPIPDVGRFSLLTDPTGATFALFQPAM